MTPYWGPFILHDNVNAERYLTMLREETRPVISTWENIEDLIFMQDGAPPHFANFTYCKNYNLEINYSHLKIGSYI